MNAARVYESPLREEQAAATKEKILQTLARLLVKGSPGTLSIADLARQAGVSVRTVYRHFPTKVALYEALFLRATSLEQRRPGPGKIDTLDDLFGAVRDMWPRIGRDMPLQRALRLRPEKDASAKRRAPARKAQVARAMAEATDGLDERTTTGIHAVVHLLTSAEALMFFDSLWDLTPAEATDAVTWAITAIADRARQEGTTP